MARPSLTEAAFADLLARLGPDREAAALAYEQIRRRLIRLFQWRGLLDAETLADETIDRVARRLSEGTEVAAADPVAYFCGVAHLLFLETVKRQARERVAAASMPAAPAASEDEPPPHLSCLEGCLAHHPARVRDTLLAYYDGGGRDRITRRARLAAESGLTVNSLRVRMHRLREGVEGCVRECVARQS